MEPETFGTFASYESTGNAKGLTHAWDRTVHLRRFGYKTRLATLQWGKFLVHSVVGREPVRPTRKERGCYGKL